PQVARHYDSFAASVKNTGCLDEGRLALETWGLRRIFALLPVAWRAFRRGKLPIPYRQRKRPGAEKIRRIFAKAQRTPSGRPPSSPDACHGGAARSSIRPPSR